MDAILLSLLAFGSTLGGGYIALRYKHRLHHLLGFTAGIVLGTVIFDLLPELLHLSERSPQALSWSMVSLVIGFVSFHIIEKLILPHSVHEHDYKKHKHPRLGILSAGALIAHSYMDGFGIGLAFLVSPAIGLATAIAVIGHDFSDGLNTVGLATLNKNKRSTTKLLLWLDAIAPVAGAMSATLVKLPSQFFSLYLGYFAGFLLYLAVGDILPEAHSRDASLKTFGVTLLGLLFAFVVSRLAS